MSSRVLVDTDVLVDFLRGHPAAVAFVEGHSDQILLSVVVVAELYEGVKGPAESAALGAFVSLFPIPPVGLSIAEVAGRYRREYGRSHNVGLADAIVAATAEVEQAALRTLNVRHYPMFTGLEPAYRKQA